MKKIIRRIEINVDESEFYTITDEGTQYALWYEFNNEFHIESYGESIEFLANLARNLIKESE